MKQQAYISGVGIFGPETDVKALITDALARRRMSRLIKMGVCAGVEALHNANITTPDAIVTATGFGFLTDSEKLLRSVIENGETSLSPTPFMQSTFNTIGSHLAIISGCHGYNMTYAHRFDSFASAMTDALMLLDEGAQSVLLVAADELTPTLNDILKRMGEEKRGISLSEGATGILITSKQTSSSVATITNWSIGNTHKEPDLAERSYPTAAAEIFVKRLLEHNDFDFANGNLTLKVQCLA